MSKQTTKVLLKVITMYDKLVRTLMDKLEPKVRNNSTRCMGCGRVGYNDYETCLCANCIKDKSNVK